MTDSRNGRYRSRFAHDDCKPLSDRCDFSDHSRWRVETAWSSLDEQVMTEAAERILRGHRPREMRGYPGE